MHGPPGFASSHVTKGFLFLTAVLSFSALLAKRSDVFSLNLSAIGRGEVWRLLTHNLVWSSSAELLLGSFLLYSWRLFERQMGSRKFAGCLFFLLLSSTLVQVGALLLSRGVAPHSSSARSWAFSSGPYAVAFGLLSCFFFDVPQSAAFRLAGLPLSDKVFVYVLALQLALSSIPASCWTAGVGLVLGALYRLEFLPFHRIRAPTWLANCCAATLGPILSGSIFGIGAGGAGAGGRRAGQRLGGSGRVGGPGGLAAARGGGYAPVGGAHGQEGEPEGEVLMGEPFHAPAAAAGFAPQTEPSPTAVAQLAAMGFDEERARAALRASRNNVALATNRLLGS